MGEPLSVLIIEDEMMDAELLCRELERGGFELHWARVETEKGLRQQLTEGHWDLIISDFAMPSFDGLRAFEVYRELKFDTPFIFVSGALGEERAVAAMRAGARDYLLKGKLGRLNAAVRRELQEAANRRSLEEARRRATQKQTLLQAALAATNAGVLEFCVPDNDKLYVSGRLAEIIGYQPAEILARKPVLQWLLDQVHAEDAAGLLVDYEDFRTGRQKSAHANFRIRHRQGHWLHISGYVIAIASNSEGVVTQAVAVVLDATETMQLQERYLQAQKMEAIGKLAGGIAHDFNNLLTAIISFTGFVRKTLPSTANQSRDDLGEVLAAADRAAALTGQLLLFSRQQPVNLQRIDVGAAIANLEKLLARTIGEDIELITSLPSKAAFALADQGQFDQIIMNLVVNARDAMPHGGSIRIAIETIELSKGEAASLNLESGPYVQILVLDTGHGIDEHTITKIFEPFFTTKGRQEGTGLGLATSYGIARKFGGVIDVASKVGAGTTFKVLLPQIEGKPDSDSDGDRSEDRLLGAETILVVEDEPALRRIVDRSLRELGYTVLLAEDAVMAMALFKEHRSAIDLVFSDIVLPRGNGHELAKDIRNENPKLRILLTSGYTDERTISSEGDFEILWKPYTPTVLAKRIRACLDREK